MYSLITIIIISSNNHTTCQVSPLNKAVQPSPLQVQQYK
jgi:hypothetical protein